MVLGFLYLKWRLGVPTSSGQSLLVLTSTLTSGAGGVDGHERSFLFALARMEGEESTLLL